MTETEWKTATGCFWIYYNTGKGLKSKGKNDGEESSKLPWIIKQFKTKEASLSKDPDRTDWKDIFAQEVKNGNRLTVKTVYADRPPWKGKLTPWKKNTIESPRYVRAYLWVEGDIEYR